MEFLVALLVLVISTAALSIRDALREIAAAIRSGS